MLFRQREVIGQATCKLRLEACRGIVFHTGVTGHIGAGDHTCLEVVAIIRDIALPTELIIVVKGKFHTGRKAFNSFPFDPHATICLLPIGMSQLIVIDGIRVKSL